MFLFYILCVYIRCPFFSFDVNLYTIKWFSIAWRGSFVLLRVTIHYTYITTSVCYITLVRAEVFRLQYKQIYARRPFLTSP